MRVLPRPSGTVARGEVGMGRNSCRPVPLTLRSLLVLMAVLLWAPAAAMASPGLAGVTFSGSAANPQITVRGAGFGTEPTPTNLAASGYTGYDYGNNLYLCDTSADPNSFCAGQYDGGNSGADTIGLVVTTYTDAEIVYSLGSDYAQLYYPNDTYRLQDGDQFTVNIKGATCSGTVSFSGAATKCAAPPPTMPSNGDAWSVPQVQDVVGELVAQYRGMFEPCTATVVASSHGDVIVTAGHCVRCLCEASGQRPTGYLFAPGHTGPVCIDLRCGENPLGIWSAGPSAAFYDSNFKNEQRYDFGFVRLAANHGQSVESAVAGEDGGWVPSLAFSPTRAQRWWSVGLPYGSSVNSPACTTRGNPQYGHCEYAISRAYCSSVATTNDGQPGPPGPPGMVIGNGCQHETEGASGGPWFTAHGQLGSVNKGNGNGYTLGTYLGSEAHQIYTQANAQ